MFHLGSKISHIIVLASESLVEDIVKDEPAVRAEIHTEPALAVPSCGVSKIVLVAVTILLLTTAEPLTKAIVPIELLIPERTFNTRPARLSNIWPSKVEVAVVEVATSETTVGEEEEVSAPVPPAPTIGY